MYVSSSTDLTIIILYSIIIYYNILIASSQCHDDAFTVIWMRGVEFDEAAAGESAGNPNECAEKNSGGE